MTPEAQARELIDRKLEAAGWTVQDMRQLNLGAGRGIAVREYPTDTGPADYMLFVDREPVGVIEAKRDDAGANLTVHEAQTERYARSALKWRVERAPLVFLYESPARSSISPTAGTPRHVHASCSTSSSRGRSPNGLPSTTVNGGEYISLAIARSPGVASTSDGRYYVRVGDTCQPVVGDDVLRLLTDRPGSPWESLTALQVPVTKANAMQRANVLQQLRDSDRVKRAAKEKTDAELLQHYGLADGPWLTNLGVLVLGASTDRARLGSAPLVQAIKYDERGNKVNKWSWDDYTLSPVELLDAVWQGIPDFRESYELPDGLYRQKLPAYDERVVRELLVNALVHRPYTQRGDIYLNLHPDRLEVVNPGRLPLGVTPRNILHESRRRNDRLATLFHDLRLMEKEGSGFDLMYEVQLSQGRPEPEPVEGADWLRVTVSRRIVRPEAIRMLADMDARFQLTQRERITLGMLAMSEGMTGRELVDRLELASTDELRSGWLGRLLDLDLVQSSGRTQATRYFVTPALMKGVGLDGQTTLRRIEPHRLRALIAEDLSRYPMSSSSDIRRRVAPELGQKAIKRALDELIGSGEVAFIGEKRWRRYRLSNGLKS